MTRSGRYGMPQQLAFFMTLPQIDGDPCTADEQRQHDSAAVDSCMHPLQDARARARASGRAADARAHATARSAADQQRAAAGDQHGRLHQFDGAEQRQRESGARSWPACRWPSPAAGHGPRSIRAGFATDFMHTSRFRLIHGASAAVAGRPRRRSVRDRRSPHRRAHRHAHGPPRRLHVDGHYARRQAAVAMPAHDAQQRMHGLGMKRRERHTVDRARSRTARAGGAPMPRAPDGPAPDSAPRVTTQPLPRPWKDRPPVAELDAAQDMRVMTDHDVARQLRAPPARAASHRARAAPAYARCPCAAPRSRARRRSRAARDIAVSCCDCFRVPSPAARPGRHGTAIGRAHTQVIAARALAVRPGRFGTHAVVD